MFLRISTSTVKNLTRCGTKSGLGVLGYTGKSAPWEMWAGDAAHVGFAKFLEGDRGAAKQCFEQRLTGLYATATEDQLADRYPAYAPSNLILIMEEWFRRSQLGLPFTFVHSAEHEMEVPLGSIRHDGKKLEVRFICRHDGLVDAEGLYTLEHKTVSKLDARKVRTLRLDPQIDGSLFACQKKLGVTPLGCYMNIVEFGYKLPDSDRMCRGTQKEPGHGVPYRECGGLHMKQQWLITQRLPEQLEEWRNQMLEQATKYLDILRTPSVRLLDQEGRWNGSCQWCEFQEFCNLGRPVERLDVLLGKHEASEGILRSGLYDDNGEKVVFV